MNITYSLVELIIVLEDEGENKSLHLERARFAHSAEQNDLIHTEGTACWTKGQKKGRLKVARRTSSSQHPKTTRGDHKIHAQIKIHNCLTIFMLQ